MFIHGESNSTLKRLKPELVISKNSRLVLSKGRFIRSHTVNELLGKIQLEYTAFPLSETHH